MYKAIKQVVSAEKVQMGGAFLDQPLPTDGLEQFDPFLLIHHWNNRLNGNSHPRDVGVGPHPHRGFSPITFVFKGSVHHQDSRGNNSIVDAGGLQWMNAGMGITHSERPEKKLASEGGDFEIIQFWLNAPAQQKMRQPEYFAIHKKDVPIYTTDDNLVQCGIISGSQFGLNGPIKHHWPVQILRLDFKSGGEIMVDIPTGFNALLYNLDGNLIVNNDQSVFMKDMVLFEPDHQNSIQILSNSNSRVIILAGKPINEPMVKYGPFVLNSQTEIMQAMRDSQMGKMGILIEKFD